MSGMDYTDIVFDGPPAPESGRFIEVENSDGESVSVGEWIERDDGFWVLRLPIAAKELSGRKFHADQDAMASTGAEIKLNADAAEEPI